MLTKPIPTSENYCTLSKLHYHSRRHTLVVWRYRLGVHRRDRLVESVVWRNRLVVNTIRRHWRRAGKDASDTSKETGSSNKTTIV